MRKKRNKINNSMAAIGEICKELHGRYGDEILPVLHTVMKEYGYQSGSKLKQKSNYLGFAEGIKAWLYPFLKGGLCEIVGEGVCSITIKGYFCSLRIEGCGRALCEALMSLDVGMASALAGKQARIQIHNSLAAGDSYCMVTLLI